MAQQITNNNLILDIESLSKTQTDYADDSVVKFDSVLDVANKTLNKDTNSKTSNIANYSKDTNLQNSSKENTVDTNTIDISSNDYKQQDNISQTATSSDTTKKTQIIAIQEETKNNTDTEIEDTLNDSEDMQKAIDTVIQYAYLGEEIDIENETSGIELDKTASTIEISDDETFETDNTLEISDDEISKTYNLDNEVLIAENKENFDILDNNSEMTTTEKVVVIPMNINTKDIDTNPTLSTPQNEDVSQINVSADVVLDEDIQVSQNLKETSKNLISQQMIDELDVTIEEVSDTTTVEVSTEETVSIMDSTEQAIKYMMDKETVNVDTKNITQKNIETDSVKITPVTQDNELEIIESNTIEIDETIEVAEDIIPNNTDKKEVEVSDNKVTEDSTLMEESEDVPETDALKNNNSESEENNNHSDSKNNKDNKTETKKDIFVSDKTYEETTDTETNPTDIKSTVSVENISETKGNIHLSTVKTVVNNNTSANISKEDVIAQIHTKLQTMNATTNAKLTMVLNPESLGKVAIQLINTKTGLTAEMQVASQAVKDILDSNLSNLKDTLTAQGIQVNDVSVKVSQSENNAEMDYTEQENNSGNKREQHKQQEQEKDAEKFEQMFSKSKENNKDNLEE